MGILIYLPIFLLVWACVIMFLDQRILLFFQKQVDEMAKKRNINNFQLATFSAWLFPVSSFVYYFSAHIFVEPMKTSGLIFAIILTSIIFSLMLFSINYFKDMYRTNDSGAIMVNVFKFNKAVFWRVYSAASLMAAPAYLLIQGTDMFSYEIRLVIPFFLIFYFVSCRPAPTSKIKVSLRERIRGWFSVLQPSHVCVR